MLNLYHIYIAVFSTYRVDIVTKFKL